MNNTFREALLDIVIEGLREDEIFRRRFGDFLFAGDGFNIYKDDFYELAEELRE
jgi:hypothetical protein